MLAELMSAVRGQVEVMSPSDLHIVKYIGSGGYGDVYLARWHGTDVAVKSLAVGAADEVRAWGNRSRSPATSGRDAPTQAGRRVAHITRWSSPSGKLQPLRMKP